MHRHPRVASRRSVSLVALYAIACVSACWQPGEDSDEVASAHAALLPAIPAFVASATVGSLDGSFSVTDDGAATYSVPIAVPPGRLGVEPSLALSYDHRAANGFVGKGFAIAGVSELSRCRPIVDVNGTDDTIRFTNADALCLDGQRLVTVKGGVWGEEGTEYRTWNDSFARIVSHAPDARGPTWFEVFARDGRIHEYGRTADSRTEGSRTTVDVDGIVHPDGDFVRYAWGISQTRDRYGNHISYRYEQRTAAGVVGPVEHWIAEINYGGNLTASLPHDRSVAFEYDVTHKDEFGQPFRPDQTTSWMGGVRFISVRSLKTIRTFVGPQAALSYALAYTAWEAGRPLRLESVQLCERFARCLPPTRFTWQAIDYGFDTLNTGVMDAVEETWARVYGTMGYHLLDIDADGDDDIFYTASRRWWLRSATGGAEVYSAPRLAGFLEPPAYYSNARVTDWDGDGRADIAMQSIYAPGGNMLEIWRSNGLTLSHDTASALPIGSHEKWWLADLDGNNLLDIASTGFVAGTGAVLAYRLHPPVGIAPQIVSDVRIATVEISTTDTDGDGRDEVLVRDGVRLKPLQVGADASIETLPYRSRRQPGELTMSLDVNGDSLMDLASISDEAWVEINTGRGFLPPARFWSSPTENLGVYIDGYDGETDKNGVRVWDYNQDGKDDLLVLSRHGNPRLLESTGDQFVSRPLPFPLAFPGRSSGWSQHQLGDINGDGLTDIFQDAGDHLQVLRRRGQQPDVITSITDGFQAQTTVTYRPLSDPAVYARAMTCNYPLRCIVPRTTVVYEHRVDNGYNDAERFNIFRHFYRDYRVDLRGHGPLGMAYHRMTDVRGGGVREVQRFTPSGDPRLASRVWRVTNYVTETSGVTHGTVSETSWELGTHIDAGTQYARARLTRVMSYETAGPPPEPAAGSSWFVTATAYSEDSRRVGTYDDWGNSTTTEAWHAGGDYETSTITFSNTPSSWLLGLPLRTQSTSFAYTTGTSGTRVSAVEYDTRGTGMPVANVEEPDEPTMFHRTAYPRDALGLVTSLTETAGVPAGLTAEAPRSATFAYDPTKMFVARVDGLGDAVTVVTEPTFGLSTRVSSSLEDQMWQYDGFGREVRTDNDWRGAVTTTTAYTATADCAMRVEHRTPGRPTAISCEDRLQRTIRGEVELPDGSYSLLESHYDRLGREDQDRLPRRAADPVVASKIYYDRANRRVLEVLPDGARITRVFSPLREWTTNPRGFGSIVVKDARRRPILSVDQLGNEVQFAYGPFNAPVRVGHRSVEGVELETLMTYDKRGRVVSREDPARGQRYYAYNGYSELRVEQTPSNAISLGYDTAGRVVRRDDDDGVSTWKYSPEGLLTSSVGPTGIQRDYQYERTTLTESTLKVDGESFPVQYEHDAYRRLSRVSYPTNHPTKKLSVRGTYANGHLSSVDDSTGLVSGGFSWQLTAADASGRTIGESFGNGVKTSRGFSPQRGFLFSVYSHRPTPTVPFPVALQHLRYSYDANGNVTLRDDRRDEPQDFTYDRLDRLLSTNKFAPLDHGADSFGNLVLNAGVVAKADESVPLRLGQVGDSLLVYDGSGRVKRQLEKTDPSKVELEVEWSAHDLPRAVWVNGAEAATYEYDADGVRVLTRQRGGVKKLAIGGGYTRTTSWSGVIHEYEIRGRDGVLGVVTVDPAKTRLTYVHSDGRDSVDMTTDDSGTVVSRYRYQAFGARVAGSEPPATLGFAGHDDDDGTTLVDMGGRVYSPKIGAFLTPDVFVQDPGYSQSWNPYAYVYNNPFTRVDPSGWQSRPGGEGSCTGSCTMPDHSVGGAPTRPGYSNPTADPRGRGGSSGSSSNAAPGTGTGPVRGERSNETGAVPLSATGGGEAKNTLADAQGAVQAGALQVAGFVGGFVFSQVGLDGVIDVKPELETAFSIGAVGGHIAGLGLAAGAIITGGSIAVGSVGAGGVVEIGTFGLGTPIVVPAAAAGVAAGSALATAGILAGVGHVAGVISATNRLNAVRSALASGNHRGRFNAARHAEGRPRLPPSYDAHHRIPQEYRSHPEFDGFDFDAPSNIRGVPNRHAPQHVHQAITNEWAGFRRANSNATRSQIEAFASRIDVQFGSHYW